MSPFTPWAQQVSGARYGEEPSQEPFQWTWPWELWNEQLMRERGMPKWAQRTGQVGTVVGLGAGLGALGMAGAAAIPSTAGLSPAIQALIQGLGRVGATPRTLPTLGGLAKGALWPLAKAAKTAKAHPWLTALGLGAGALTLANRPGQLGVPPATLPTGEPLTPPVTPTVLPEPDAAAYWNPTTGQYEENPSTKPIIITDESGNRWHYSQESDEWISIPSPTAKITPEQELIEAEKERQAKIEYLRLQYELEQQGMYAQAQMQRQLQAQAAAEATQQMYAADPYKYWAQMGAMTPEAVARLTGGRIGAGQPFQQGTALSTPSAQWWGNLLPSEQQQIMGGANWLGVNPEDWYSMYRRMIPGLGARQMEPVWAR